MRWRFLLMFCLAGATVVSGCAPSFSPLYRDYDVEPAARAADDGLSEAAVDDADVYARIRAALTEAGWTEAAPAAPNVISTEPRQLSDWGLYRVVVSLDVVPVGEQHVRVLFHPSRRYFTGAQTKIPYLSGGMRGALLPDLNDAFEARGLYPIGTPRERDEERVAGT
jgi:hypothetical protein